MEKYIYTPKKELYGKKIYIGNLDGEEYFITPIKWACGWYWGGVYLQGLRPETEEILRGRQRESEPEDFGLEIPSQMTNYFDKDKWLDDLEEEWANHHDIQEEQEREGETYYLGYGTHTHCDSVLLNDCKGNYKIALKKFDKLVFTEEQFNKLIDILKRFYSCKEGSQNNKKYLKTMEKAEQILKEFEEFTDQFKRLPTKEFWTTN